LICVIILKKENKETLFIDTWFMSCRVLSGDGKFCVEYHRERRQENGFAYLKGEYIPTAKNEMVKNHYHI